MTTAELKAALRAGRNLFGTLIVSPSPFWPKVIGDCGLDFVFIDTEHIALDRQTLSWMCRTYAALGLPPLVRIPNHDPYTATVVLDDGAAGVIVPYVETAEVARKISGATKLRPLKGERLEEALGGLPLEPGLSEYISRNSGDNLLVVNIESVPAMKALDEILPVAGLDAVLIGPHDLSTSLGIPEQYDDPRFLKACEQILGQARRAGICAGIHQWLSPEQQARFFGMGANLLIHKADIMFFRSGLRQELAEIRKHLGDSGPDRASGSVNV